MKYRIKIITYKNGRQEFIPQVKKRFYWTGISWDGEENMFLSDVACDTREQALNKIDKHHSGGGTKHSIRFEYIEK